MIERIKRGKALMDSKDRWRTPIQFFGKVIDEESNPVSQAHVKMTWTDLSAQGHSERVMYSDTNGLFTLEGVRGYALSVRVEKGGYYTSVSNRISFRYADQDTNFVPDPANPVVFRLRKKGVAESVVHVEFPAPTVRYKLRGDGIPVAFDLLKGAVAPVGSGQIQIAFSRQASESDSFDWRWLISAWKGSIAASSDEFQFEAPTEGYQMQHEVFFSAADRENWKGELLQNYFIKFDNGTYARISIRLLAHNGVLRFESFLNPSGSRNLEYDPAVQHRNGG